MVKKWDVVFGTDVEGVEDVEGGGEYGPAARRGDAVEGGAQGLQVNTDWSLPASLVTQ